MSFLGASTGIVEGIYTLMYDRNWIGKLMKEYHEQEAEIIDISEVIKAKTAGATPPGEEDWLSKMKPGDIFLCTKKHLINSPELIKVMIINKTKGGNVLLMLDIPGSNSINMYVSSILYSRENVRIEIL